jgi:hypothetical protein
MAESERKRNLKSYSIDMNIVTLTLFIGIIFVFIIPLIIINFNLLGQWSNFSQTGQIGDTIGGITAPIVGLVGAILVFYSFKIQLEFNIKQSEALDNERDIRKQQQAEKFIQNLSEIVDVYYHEKGPKMRETIEFLNERSSSSDFFNINIKAIGRDIEELKYYIHVFAYLVEKLSDKSLDKSFKDINMLKLQYLLAENSGLVDETFMSIGKLDIGQFSNETLELYENLFTLNVMYSAISNYCSIIKINKDLFEIDFGNLFIKNKQRS